MLPLCTRFSTCPPSLKGFRGAKESRLTRFVQRFYARKVGRPSRATSPATLEHHEEKVSDSIRSLRETRRSLPKARKGWYVRPDEELSHLESSVYEINELGLKKGRVDGIMDGYFVSRDIHTVIKPGFSYRLNDTYYWKLPYPEEDKRIIKEQLEGIFELSLKRNLKEASDKLLVLIRSYSPLGYQFRNIKSNISLYTLLHQYCLRGDSEDDYVDVLTHYFFLGGGYRFTTLDECITRLVISYTKQNYRDGLDDVLRVMALHEVPYNVEIVHNLLQYHFRHRNDEDLIKVIEVIVNGFPYDESYLMNSLFIYFCSSQDLTHKKLMCQFYPCIPKPDIRVTHKYFKMLKAHPTWAEELNVQDMKDFEYGIPEELEIMEENE